MQTTINNAYRVLLVQGSGWNTDKFFCNLEDLTKCAQHFGINQPYRISEYFNFKLCRLSVEKVTELLEANQLDSSFFTGKVSVKVATGNGYDYYKGKDSKGIFYDLVPEGQPAPKGGYYSKEHILKVKQVPDLF